MVDNPGRASDSDATSKKPTRRLPPKSVRATTRAGVIWTFTIVAIVVLIFLVIFMMQNQAQATVYFLGLQGQMALGVSMLLAAVGGAVVVAIVAAVRIIQLRSRGSATAKRADHGEK
ncbi:lipopolysaccharide assembly protein LapA domain-containing protein [Paeniglutamicibacter sp. MACA_103]|uniref:lipopolysaccharide assembly protein LapA domain-containing protein n=1 Tax=Paeniglutamicibacter sp. MACA_103 TaxID=3377337 RepID=UPI003893CE75